MGLFQYNRLMFGITSAPAIWQRTMVQILEGTSAISCILGDMIRAVARALIGGLNIHIFMLCPINFFSNQVDFKRN